MREEADAPSPRVRAGKAIGARLAWPYDPDEPPASALLGPAPENR